MAEKRLMIVGGTSAVAKALLDEVVKNDYFTHAVVVSRAFDAQSRRFYEQMSPAMVLEVDLVECDLSKETLRPELLEMAQAADTLYYVAGTMEEDDLQKSCRVNLLAAVELIDRFCVSKPAGDIALIGSMAGVRGKGRTLHYGMFKSALHAYAEGITEAHPHLRTCLMVPGFIATKMLAGAVTPAALTSSPQQVAQRTLRCLENGGGRVYSSTAWHALAVLFRLLPIGMWRRASK